MNAFQIPGLQWSLPSSGVIERWRFVSVNAAGLGIRATASTPVVGASTNKTADDETVEISDGIVMVHSGSALAAGIYVKSDETGRAVSTTAADAVGVTITACTGENMLVSVKM